MDTRSFLDVVSEKISKSMLTFFLLFLLLMIFYEFTKEMLEPYFNHIGSEVVAVIIPSIIGTLLAIMALRHALEINETLKGTINELEITKEALQKNEDLYRSLVESTEDSIYVVDKESRYMFVNRKHIERMGIMMEECVGREYSKFHTAEESEEFASIVGYVFRFGESVQKEHKSKRDDKYFLRTLSPVKSPEGVTNAVTVISKNVTMLKKMEDSLRALSLQDELTGLYNRRGFITLINQQIKIAARMEKGMLLIYADVDDLKVINDTFGHSEGDRALIEAANILKDTFRESDIIARIGGDEFVTVMLAEHNENFNVLTDRLNSKIAIVNASGKNPFKLSISTGVVYNDAGYSYEVDALLHIADKLMYESKKSKKSS